MAVFKCKMCGGDLEISEGVTIAECEYCGTKQTVPNAMDENLQNIFNRANTLRIKSEFDKAEKLYERIIQSDGTQAEAYWGLILCKYGIEYVDDPATFKKVPTCHRASYESIIADDDYKSALQYADGAQRSVYEEQAGEIDRIQKEILALAQREETYDVFICYKETDSSGARTQDSVIANDIYYQLTNEGFKVFYAAITLEGKLGSAYEPIIFAALNSAKVMLSIGTKPEYFNAVWVKNEWSRYLKIIQKDRSKLLIPCYRDMDAYELPEEFAHLQAQDMSKIGFITDVVRGIKNVVESNAPAPTVVKETVVAGGNTNTAPLLKRAFMFLEDGDWSSADEYCEKVLDIDPECADAYLGKLMAELKVKVRQNLKNCEINFANKNSYQKTIRFADETLKNELQGYVDFIVNRNLEAAYNNAVSLMKSANSESTYKNAADEFRAIANYKASKEKIEFCQNKIEEIKAAEKQHQEELARKAEEKRLEKERIAEEKRIEAERLAEEKRIAKAKAAKKMKIIISVLTFVICAIITFVIVLNNVIIPNGKYNDAIALMDEGKYSEAISAFEALDGYKDSTIKITECNTAILDNKYNDAVDLMDSDTIKAYEALTALDGYKDSSQKAKSIYNKYKVERLKVAKVGDYVLFGAYEQDNNTTNGKEDIEWLVLEIKDGKALVISKYALDWKQFNTKYNDVTWENCALRKWLNNDFFSAAFSKNEKAMIPTVVVSSDEKTLYATNHTNATQDKIFLLSITEAYKFFKSNKARCCEPTDYAVKNGAWGEGNNAWWLRTPTKGEYAHGGAHVISSEGNLSTDGFAYESDGVTYPSFHAVRPAMWIDLSKVK